MDTSVSSWIRSVKEVSSGCCEVIRSGMFQVASTATAEVQNRDSTIRYGLFRGELGLHNLITPTFNTLFMTCIPELNSCAVSCKTEANARNAEVRALAQGYRPTPACVSVTDVDTSDPLETPPVISFALYVCLLVFVFLQLAFALVAAALAIVNATKNPTEPVFGLPGCLWTNLATAVLGIITLLLFGIYWATSGLKDHLAVSYIALGLFVPGPALGYSYWLLICSVFCNLSNVGLIQLRAYLLERDPPPPEIKVDNHPSDGTIFIY
ncbi:hypothetical protein O3G_MSEX010185 [Manduca sexta]|uniref:Uncharacterized protein n=1 Tax=Manduca sexta TaxID=7130 RepID=A0A922CSZ4_MANSE|nr:hypothetical protein O3G_MSEX010185 [Manduca sexta]